MNTAGLQNAVRSLTGNLAAFIVPPLVLNGFIFGLGWDGNSPPSPYLPPGWVVGTIWMLLFAAMGIARWLLVREPSTASASARLLVALAFLCTIYPLYTAGLRSESIGLVGCVVTGFVAVWVALRVLQESRPAAALTGLVIVWLAYATVGLALTMRAEGLL